MVTLQSTNPLKGIVFDLDGTLANTFLDFSQMCLEAGLPIGTKILEHCSELTDDMKVAEILAVVEQHEIAGAHRAEWILDAQRILAKLNQANIPMAIVTRNMRQAAKITIEKLAIPIDLVLTRNDCLPKPDPQGLLMVADLWGLRPAELIYVGDYQFDLMAAKNAGMHSCLLVDQSNQHFASMADKLIDNFAELLPLFGLIE